MPRPWRNDDQQLEYEAQLPDRFEDGSAWIELARRAKDLPAARRYPAGQWETLTGQTIGAAGAEIIAAGLYELRPDYEAARLRAQYLTVAGADTVRRELDTVAVAARRAREPNAVGQHIAAITILQQAFLDPDRRLPFSRLITALNLQPRTVTPRSPRR